ncbi:MAG: hypothetical protein NVSMB1_18080 [Polyangiales bacterium]
MHGSASALYLALVIELVGCTRTLTEGDCARYRDRLEGWAQGKSAPATKTTASAAAVAPDADSSVDAASGGSESSAKETNGVEVEFMKTCAGTTVSRGAHSCLEAATDETSFFRCLE